MAIAPEARVAMVDRYEELRGQALGLGGLVAGGRGWALLVRRGMLAWIRAWSSCGPSASESPAASSNPLTPDQSGDVVQILVSMALSHC